MTDQQKEIFLAGVAVGINRSLNKVWDVMDVVTSHTKTLEGLEALRVLGLQFPDENPILEEIKKGIDTFIKIKSN